MYVCIVARSVVMLQHHICCKMLCFFGTLRGAWEKRSRYAGEAPLSADSSAGYGISPGRTGLCEATNRISVESKHRLSAKSLNTSINFWSKNPSANTRAERSGDTTECKIVCVTSVLFTFYSNSASNPRSAGHVTITGLRVTERAKTSAALKTFPSTLFHYHVRFWATIPWFVLLYYCLIFSTCLFPADFIVYLFGGIFGKDF